MTTGATDRARGALSAVVAVWLFALWAIGDHLGFGPLATGWGTFWVAAGAALGGLVAWIGLIGPMTLVGARLVEWVRSQGARAWGLALFGWFGLAGMGVWSMGVYFAYPGHPIDRPHLLAYAAGILPIGPLALVAARRLSRRPVPRHGPTVLALGYAAFFHGALLWLPAIFPSGTSYHLVFNGTTGGILASVSAAALALVMGEKNLSRRTAALLGSGGLVLLVALALPLVAGWSDRYAVRDAAARGGRLSRSILRHTQFLLFPRGRGLGALAARAAAAPEAAFGGPAVGPAASPGADAAWAELSRVRPSGILIITIDATRADVTDTPEEFPPLARFAREGLVFTDHHSVAPGTREAMGTTFTGAWFWTDERRDGPNLFSRFKAAGWHTIAVGYATGSNEYVQNGAMATSFDVVVPRPEPSGVAHADRMTDATLEKLAAVGDRPFLAWVHYLDPHAPYDAPGGSRKESYTGEVTRVGTEIERLLEGLRSGGLLDRTLVLLTADHGESFGEHGNDYHNQTLYEEVLHVPLIIRAPGGAARGKFSHGTSGLDLGPALLALAGLGPTGRPALFEAGRVRPIVGFTALIPHPWRPVGMLSVLRGRWKLIYELRLRSAELYDLESDPGETVNLVDARPDVAAALARDLLEEIRRTGVHLD